MDILLIQRPWIFAIIGNNPSQISSTSFKTEMEELRAVVDEPTRDEEGVGNAVVVNVALVDVSGICDGSEKLERKRRYGDCKEKNGDAGYALGSNREERKAG